MLPPKLLTTVLAGMFFVQAACYGQATDSLSEKVIRFPGRLFSRIQSKTARLDRQLTRQTGKYLARMARREERLRREVSDKDSLAGAQIFASSAQQYSALSRKISTDSGGAPGQLSGEYLPYVDSLKGSLSFLQQHPSLVRSPSQQAELQSTLAGFGQLQAKMQDADEVRDFIRSRKEQIKHYLSQNTDPLPAGLARDYRELNKEVYYYSQQIREYKQLLNDPGQLEKKALSLLGQLPTFRQWMKDNGQLAGLFGVPAGYGNPSALTGLQTRDQVSSTIQSQLSAGGSGAVTVLQQNLQSAEQYLDGFKDKLSKLGSGSGNIDMPDFKPNNQRTKTFWRRLEFGVNLQTSRINAYYPNILDLGGSIGYRLTDKSTVGLGSSFKIGLGSDIRHMALTMSGAGLRSFLDVAIKGTFSATGGLEYNHTAALSSLQDVRRFAGWTTSGLVGVIKTVSVKSRVFKKTKLSLLWDFLSYRQVPRTSAVLFRVGYGF